MTEPHLVLARRCRPQTFSEVIGQEFAVRALSRAMATGRIAHAYLLTGTHGVGKTSIARIIAKSLCCDDGPTATPCGTCHHCFGITADVHPDVTEVDAASHTGVDDVRAIVEGARYMPVDARYRIYIIDEAHMLSRAAFAALLKTLEEPPPEVVFVLATTDPQKLPTTIISRCQRYELRRVPVNTLAAHYKGIADGHLIDDAAINLIAEAAGGSVRDGLSLLEAAFALNGVITEGMVRAMLGSSGRAIDVLEPALRGDAAEALAAFDDVYARGCDSHQLAQEMLDLVYQVTRAQVLHARHDARVAALAETPPAALARAWGMLLKGCVEVSTAARPNHALEMLLVRLATVADLPTAAEVIRVLERVT